MTLSACVGVRQQLVQASGQIVALLVASTEFSFDTLDMFLIDVVPFGFGLKAVAAGEETLIPPERGLVSLEPRHLVLSALKPSEDGSGIVIRLLNPGAEPARAVLSLGFDFEDARSLRLDEKPGPDELTVGPRRIEFDLGPHALRSLFLRPANLAADRNQENAPT